MSDPIDRLRTLLRFFEKYQDDGVVLEPVAVGLAIVVIDDALAAIAEKPLEKLVRGAEHFMAENIVPFPSRASRVLSNGGGDAA